MTDSTHPHRRPSSSLETTLEAMRLAIAVNLSIDPDRLRMHDPRSQSVIGVTGERWQIFCGDQWQDLPWHFDGPLSGRWSGSGWGNQISLRKSHQTQSHAPRGELLATFRRAFEPLHSC